MSPLLIPWVLCIIFVIVAVSLFLDSRAMERSVDKEHAALEKSREVLATREVNVQKREHANQQIIAAYQVKLDKANERIDDLTVSNLDLNERLLAARRRAH